MAATWVTYLLLPLAIGGAGRLTAEVRPETGKALTAVRVFAGPVAATGATDANPALSRVDLESSPDSPWLANLWGAPQAAGQVLTWFCAQDGTWEAGPVVAGVDLSSFWDARFPWAPEWIVARLQEVAAAHPPLPAGKPLRVSRAFPRDTATWPMLNVQVDSLAPTGEMIGNLRRSTGDTVVPAKGKALGRIWQAQLSLNAWCGAPEERSLLAPWLGAALELLLEMGKAEGWKSPTFTLHESEDFATLAVPAFLVTANLSLTLESTLQIPNRTGYGHLVVAR